MKKRYKPIFSLALVALLAVLFAAGCNSGSAAPVADASLFGTPVSVTPTVEASVPESALAPDFTLASATGESVSLGDLLDGREAVVIVFYRGFF